MGLGYDAVILVYEKDYSAYMHLIETIKAFKTSQKLFNMLNSLPKKNEKVFGLAVYRSMENQFVVTRKRTANKLQNPRIMQIHFHTLRHWKATMEYHKTRDILHIITCLVTRI
jgi:hypothetical protein